ncbi:Cactin [Vitis vinifera]|uniref:Cactin n=1 Tax=Vitis vinifera TaxID=29760 RepID=A0A438EK24_VITVI|nr:Cactin [Vitis vinifera]
MFSVKAEKKRQRERMAEIEKVKKRREERAIEKAQHEEEMALLARERARAEFQDWEKKEEEFHFDQSKVRSDIRLREGRLKPIDILSNLLNGSDDFDMDISEPYMVFKVRGRGGEGARVCLLLFADDTLVFCEASQDQMKYLCWTLVWFKAISGLRINLDKSELIQVRCVENAKVLAVELGCKFGSLLSSYLRLLLGAPFKSVIAWDGVEERTVRLRLEQIQRDFLWGGGVLEWKSHLGAVGAVFFIKGDTFELGRVLCGKEEKGSLESRPLMYFLDGLEDKEQFENDVLSIQRLKSSFVCFLWSETKLFIKDGPSTLLGCID